MEAVTNPYKVSDDNFEDFEKYNFSQDKIKNNLQEMILTDPKKKWK
jgi:hypothetical protein